MPEDATEDAEWLMEILDGLHMMASTETAGISVEGPWDREVLLLRRWLAEDRLSSVDIEMENNQDGRTTTRADLETDEVDLMQGGKPPWRTPSKPPKKGHTSEPQRRRRHRNARERSREKYDRDTNAHRPWRASMHETATPPTTRKETPSSARRGTCHPATVELPDGPRNAGIHAWHAMLGMVNPMEAPDRFDYGFTGYQQQNIRASLSDMNMRERFQMITSFLQRVALMLTEIADISAEIVPEGTDNDEDLEGDDSHFMERYLTRTTPMISTPPPQQNRLTELFGNAFEMELRSLVAAMELSEAGLAKRRAGALLRRIRMQYGLRSRDEMPDTVILLESAMVTFLPDSGEGGDVDFHDLPAQDQDFVEYWWSMLFRQLQGASADQSRPSSSVEARPTQRDTIDEEDLNLAADELQLMRQLEQQELAQRRRPEEVAREEFREFEESQDSEAQARADDWLRQREASEYRNWEQWEVAQELKPPRRVGRGQVRVRVQGGVTWPSTSWASTAATGSGPTQTMEWTMEHGQCLQMRVCIEPGRANTSDVGIQPDDDGRTAKTPEGEEGMNDTENERPVPPADEKKGKMKGEAETADSEARAVEGLRVAKRRAESTAGEPSKLSKGWKMPAGMVEITLDDSQPPPKTQPAENTAEWCFTLTSP